MENQARNPGPQAAPAGGNASAQEKIVPDTEETEAKAKAEKQAKKAQAQAEAATRAERMKKRELRALRTLGEFIHGTVKGGIDGIADGGRLGFFVAMGTTVVGTIAMGFGGFAGAFFLSMLLIPVGGMVLGGVVGTLTGGIKKARENEQKEDAVEARTSGRHVPSYRDVKDFNEYKTNFNFDRFQQQQRENNTDWQDRVRNEQSAQWSRGA